MINFLYCFDENFNIQGLTSINSLLDAVSEKINLHIIHKDVNSLNKFVNKIESHANLNNLHLYNFEISKVALPETKTHVSEATFYRLFIEEYLPKDLKKIIYLDADIICVNNPIFEIYEVFKEMENQGTIISAYVESTRDTNPEFFKKLNLQNDNQFNAGVLIINFEKWIQNNTQSELISVLEDRKSSIFDYDQEVLNVYFDNNFTKLNKNLNYQAVGGEDLNYVNKLKKDAIFLHYLGKNKPWSFNGILEPSSIIYQDSFKMLNLGSLHLLFTLNKKNLRALLKILFNLEFLKFKYPLSYIKHIFLALFKKNI